MKIKKYILKQSKFRRDFITLFSGAAVSQIIPIAITPILSRIYSPKEIGVFSVIFSCSSILGTVISGRYELAIVLPKSKQESKNLVVITLFTSIFLSIVCLILIYFFQTSFASWLDISEYKGYLYLIVFMALSYVFFQTFSYYLNRESEYLKMTVGKIIQSVVMAIFQVVAFTMGAVSLILGRILGQIVNGLYYFKYLRKDFRNFRSFKIKKLIRVALKYRDFPMYTMPNSLLNTSSNNLPQILLTKLYSLNETAFYSWSSRLIMVPISFITVSIQQIFYVEASKLHNEGRSVKSLMVSVYKKLFLLGLLPFTILFAFAPAIFGFVLGKDWAIAGIYSQYLTPWYFVTFLNSPISCLVFIKNKQKFFLVIELFLFLSRALLIYLGYILFHSAEYSIILFGGLGFFYQIFLVFYFFRLAKQN